MAEPIAPTNYSIAPTGIAPTGIRAAAPVQTLTPKEELDTAYKFAAQTGDANALSKVAELSVGTPLQQEATLAADVVKKNQGEFDRLIAPIAQKGGPDTPEGRKAAADTWKHVGSDPKFGTWLVHYLMKDPNARAYAGVGKITSTYETGLDGSLLNVEKNDLGQITGVTDSNGNPVSKQEYERLQAANGIGKVVTEERMKAQAKFNAEARNLEDKQINAYQAFAPKLDAYGKDIKALGEGLVASGVKPGNIADLVSFGTQSLSSSRSQNEAINKLKSATRGGSASITSEEAKSLAAQAKIPGVVTVSGDGKSILINNKAVNASDLDQYQTTGGTSTAFEQATSGNQQQRAMGALFKNLSAPQQQAVLRLVDLQSNVTNDMNTLRNEVGDLKFMVNLNDFDPLKGFGSTMAKAESMIHNAQMINSYAEDRKQKLQKFDSVGQNPTAGELQAAFTRTPGYHENADNLHKKMNDYLNYDLLEAQNSRPAVKPVTVKENKPKAPPVTEEKPSRFSRHVKKD